LNKLFEDVKKESKRIKYDQKFIENCKGVYTDCLKTDDEIKKAS